MKKSKHRSPRKIPDQKGRYISTPSEFLPSGAARTKRSAEQMAAGAPFGLDYPATQVGVAGGITVFYDPSLGANGLALAQQMLGVVLAPAKI